MENITKSKFKLNSKALAKTNSSSSNKKMVINVNIELKNLNKD